MSQGQEDYARIWPVILEEAVRCCNRARRTDRTVMERIACSASAIILARAAFESFSSEYILTREIEGLATDAGLKDMIRTIIRSCAGETPNLNLEPWNGLMLVNNLRNFIIHHNSLPRPTGELPFSLAQNPLLLSLLGASTGPLQSWESIIYTPKVARWCCEAVGASIVALVDFPLRRKELPELAISFVNQALASEGYSK